MNTKMCVFLVVLLLLPAVGRTQGEEHGIDIVLTSQRLIEVEPGKIVTGSYLVTNRTGREVVLHERLELPAAPEGWQPLAAYERPVFLEAGGRSVQLITFVVPKRCPQGKYEIVYSLTDSRSLEVQAVEIFTVVVKPLVKVDAVIEDQPDIVMAGDRYNVRLRLVNLGNSTTPMRLEASGSPDFPLSLDVVKTSLEAGKSQLVNLSVSTDGELRNRTNHVVEINAVAETPVHGSIAAKRTVFVEIIPRLLAAVDPRNRVPTAMSIISAGENDEAGMQIEYAGGGSLDESGSHRIDFALRGPDIKDRSLYGTRDVLHLSYRGPWLDVLLGDRVYELSPLSERLVYGRGGEISIHPGGLEIGSFYMQTRWESPGREEMGTFVGYRHENILELRANYLNKRKNVASSFTGYETDIYSVQARLSPGAAFDLGLEYGYSMDAGEGDEKDPAYRVTLDGELADRIWYTFESTHAGPRYRGYYSDVLYSSGTVAASIFRNLRGNISYRVYEHNLDLDPAKPSAMRERSYRGVLSYAFASGTSISLDYKAISRRNELNPSQLDFQEGIWRVGAGHTFGTFGVQVYSERGQFDDHRVDEYARTLYRHSIYAHYHPTPTQSYSLTARTGHNSFLGDPERTTSIGVSTSFHLLQSLRLGLSFQANNIGADRLPKQNHVLSTLDYTLPNSHTVSLKARWFEFEKSGRSDLSFYAAYTIPFDIPGMKKTSIGAMEGRVLDRDRPGYPPMDNVLVSVGNTATMTDHSGKFSFPVMKPGRYAVQLDQRSMGMNRIITDASPLTIEVIGGETVYREIGVSTAAEISGTVVVMAIDPAVIHGAGSKDEQEKSLFVTGSGEVSREPMDRDDLIESGGLGDIIVEVSQGKEIYRQTTDQKGNFSFPGLRPGIWRFRVYENGIPKHHYIQNPKFEVELAKGEERTIAVHVLPKLRAIEIIGSGTVDEGD